MAKKGGVSEINGFVSVKDDEKKTAPKKVLKKDPLLVSNKNAPSGGTSKVSKPSVPDLKGVKKSSDVDQKRKKTADNEIKTKKSSDADLKVKRSNDTDLKVKRSNDTDPKLKKASDVDTKTKRTNDDAKTRQIVQSDKSSSKKTNEISKSQKTKVADPKAGKEQSSENSKLSKDSKINVTAPKRHGSQDNGSKTSKPTNNAVSRVKALSDTKSKVSPPRSPAKDTKIDSKNKTLSTASKKSENTKPVKGVQPSKLPTSVQAKSQKKESSQSKVPTPVTKSDNGLKKPAKTSSKSSSSAVHSSGKVSTKEKNKDDIIGNEAIRNKVPVKDQPSIYSREPKIEVQKGKDVASEENLKSNYKDVMYFEVDMGSMKETSNKAEKITKEEKEYSIKSKNSDKTENITEVVRPPLNFDLNMNMKEDNNNNNPIKTDHARKEVFKPPPSAVSRQGTFTKEDNESSIDSLNLPIIEVATDVNNASNDEEYDYEDDFEDYESDFEEYVSESGVSSDSESSTDKGTTIPAKIDPVKTEEKKSTKSNNEKTVEEEKKLDSGNYDLTTKVVLPQSIKEKQLAQIKEAISRENSLYSDKRTEVEPIANNEVIIMDFLGALKKQEAEEGKKQVKRRSSLILDMIDLHVQQISIFELEFFFLDDSDSLYRNCNVSHVGTQAEVITRNEDVQTEEIRSLYKWTQFPLRFHNLNESTNPLEMFVEDLRGFGGENISVDISTWMNPYYNPEKLYNFVESAGQVVLIMLEEEERWRADGSVSVHKAKHDHGFSRGYIPIQTKNLQFLKNRPICDVLFSPHNPNVFLSSHRFIKDIENVSSFDDQFLGRSVICLWSILEPSQPLSMFVASCQVSAIAYDIAHTNLLYAGLTDGSVCLWDSSERSIFHKETLAGTMEYLLRTPTYCTSHLLGDGYHNNVVVAIQSLGYEIEETHSVETFSPTQVVTLDTDGKVIVWVTVSTASTLDTNPIMEMQDFGQAYWGRFKLVASRTLSPADNLPYAENTWSLQFLCMALAPHTNRSILVGTNTGSVVQCLISEEKSSIPVYSNKEESDCTTSVMSIERSPHQFPVFLAGCSNGTVRIHLMDRKRPIRILMMDSQMKGVPLTKIRWSLLGAGMFFVLDKTLSLHIWDLCKSEMSPLLSLSMKKFKATHYDISCDNRYVYIALVVNKDRLEIHRFKGTIHSG